MGVVLVVAAHLIPALTRGKPATARMIGFAMWAAAMAATCYGHATFFVFAVRISVMVIGRFGERDQYGRWCCAVNG
ncbi:hypothetical protein WI86_12800, partial [Burkholderia ubonensis]